MNRQGEQGEPGGVGVRRGGERRTGVLGGAGEDAAELGALGGRAGRLEGPRYHPLGQNGRKEQVLSAASPEWFLGDRSPDIKRTSIPRVDPNIAYCGKIIL